MPAERPTRRSTRRLFFALWPDEATRAALVRATRKAVRRSGGRPVPPDHYHITLAFLGNQPAALCDAIADAGATVAAGALECTLDRFGYWPKPRVFWIGSSEPVPAMAELSRTIWDRMEDLDLRREQRSFKAHLTLARKVAALPEVSPPDPVIWRAPGFALIESVTEQRGAVYTVVKEFPLSGSPVIRFTTGSPSDPKPA